MDQTRLDELIEKYAWGSITPDEMEELLRWYRSEEIQEVEWPAEQPDEKEQLQQRMLQRLRVQIGQTVEDPSPILHEEPMYHTGGRPWFKLRGWRVAASVLVVISGLWMARQYLDLTGHPDLISVRNPSGKIQAIRLPDSTEVWLNAETSLKYASNFGKVRGKSRELFLEGEAFFDVTTDADRPFVVHSGRLTTTVLGTSFNIKAFEGEQQAAVSVIRGKVQVQDSCRVLDVLTPARQLQIDTRTGAASTTTIDTSQVMGWKLGKLQFSGQTMTDIVASLGRWYNVQFIFTDSTAGRCRYYLNFENTMSLQDLLQVLKESTDMTFRLDETAHKVFVSGRSCQ